MTQYNVLGGGFYRYTLNTRTNKGAWLAWQDRPLKRTEKDSFTYDEATEIVKRNNASYMKMAGVMIKEA